MSKQDDIYIGQWLLPLIIIALLNLFGIMTAIKIEKKLMKYLACLIHGAILSFGVYMIYNIISIGGGIKEVINNINY